ncbi:MAG: PH domain-containing protein [Candidatus Saccharimonadales bacterium]
MKYCGNCGQSITTDSNFCTSCGHKISAAVDGAPTRAVFDYTDQGRHSRIVKHTPNSGSLVQDATIEFGDLHPNAIWLFFIYYIGHSVFLLPLILIGAFFEPWLVVLLGVYLVVHYVAARITYKNYRFEITPVAFTKEYGIIHKQAATIPLEQIENVNISRNLIDRMLGLSHIEIETAGTGGAKSRMILGGTTSASEGYIPGVAAAEADDLRDLMLARAKG